MSGHEELIAKARSYYMVGHDPDGPKGQAILRFHPRICDELADALASETAIERDQALKAIAAEVAEVRIAAQAIATERDRLKQEVGHLEKCLRGHDDFLVENDLWIKFTTEIPARTQTADRLKQEVERLTNLYDGAVANRNYYADQRKSERERADRLQAINAKLLAAMKEIAAADEAALAKLEAMGLGDVRSPENTRLVELARATIVLASEETSDEAAEKLRPLTAIASERKRIREIVIRHTKGHFWIGEAILVDMDAAAIALASEPEAEGTERT